MASGFDPAGLLRAAWQAGGAVAQRYVEGVLGQSRDAVASLGGVMEAYGGDAEALKAAYADWLARQAALGRNVVGGALGSKGEPVIDTAPEDRRFADPAWSERLFYDALRQEYLINADVLKRVVEALPLAGRQTRNRLRFVTRQLVDAMAPTNFPLTNPEFVRSAVETRGLSVAKGLKNLLGDVARGRISMSDESAFEVGRDLAITPGAVVFENELIQLIQYAPTTAKVGQRPLLIVPPCINKFYILDLQPENSLVRYAVSQGNTVFLISWRNVGSAQQYLTWDDYLELGPLAAFDVASRICGVKQINALGFCIGGTLLSSALAVARARGQQPVASLTLLTTLLDFSDTGEIGYFVDEPSVAQREMTVGNGGLMKGAEMATAFAALRANDLIWQYVVNNYLKGGQPPPFDLLYWNADATNLPGPFFAWYLRNMYLENRLRQPGKLKMCGEKVDLGRVDMPAFVYASREDHIVPWKTAYQNREILGGPTTFVLGASGHIAGVVNPASKNKRCHWVSDSETDDPEAWLEEAQEAPGSWWPVWARWLKAFAGTPVAARKVLGNAAYPPGEAAPGRYVLEQPE